MGKSEKVTPTCTPAWPGGRRGHPAHLRGHLLGDVRGPPPRRSCWSSWSWNFWGEWRRVRFWHPLFFHFCPCLYYEIPIFLTMFLYGVYREDASLLLPYILHLFSPVVTCSHLLSPVLTCLVRDIGGNIGDDCHQNPSCPCLYLEMPVFLAYFCVTDQGTTQKNTSSPCLYLENQNCVIFGGCCSAVGCSNSTFQNDTHFGFPSINMG